MAGERQRDAIELIYDEYVADEKLKHGTKYEILAAIVFKALERDHRVVHDLRLRGPGLQTKHQIDVTVENRDGRTLRLVVECRHLFETSKRPMIDLDAVRSFASVVRDLQPDVGMMLTTVGYTEDARIYAKEQGVVLGVLRAFRDEDWAGRVQEIIVRGDLTAPSDLRIKSWTPVDEQEIARVKPLLDQQGDIAQLVNAHDAHFRDEHGDETESFADVLDPIYQRLQRGLEPGVNSGFVDLDKMRWVRLGAVDVAVRGFEWEIEVTQFSHEFVIGLGDRVATLLLQTLDGQLDFAIFDRDLLAFEVGEDGEIVPRRDEASPA